jgi:hypothetical protein
MAKHDFVTAALLKETYLGNTFKRESKVQRKPTLIQATDETISNFESKVKKAKRSAESLKKWKTTKCKLVAFLNHHFKKNDVLLTYISVNFGDQFFDFLTLVDNLENNTAMKYLKNTKQILR